MYIVQGPPTYIIATSSHTKKYHNNAKESSSEHWDVPVSHNCNDVHSVTNQSAT